MEEKRYEIQEVFDMLGKSYLSLKTVGHGRRESIEVDGFKVKRSSLRYSLFYQKGIKCVCCGKEGTHFKLDVGEGQDPTTSNRRHFNLYAEDGTLITKDHIVPKSFGGADNVDNLQVMCKHCNELKRNTPEQDMTVDLIVATHIESGEKTYYKSIEAAAWSVSANIKGIFQNKTKQDKRDRQNCVKKAIADTVALINAIETGCVFVSRTWKWETKTFIGKTVEEMKEELKLNDC